MKKFLCILILISALFQSNAQSIDTFSINKQVSYYEQNEQFDSASLLLVQSANKAQDCGELEIALNYQIRNCELVEQQINAFAAYGLTLDALYANYGMVFVLQRDLGKKADAINTYLELAQTIKIYSPDILPFYTNLIASTLGDCTLEPWADSVYCLQDALDVLKQQEVTDDNVEKYFWFCQCFNMNRMYNSFDNKMFVRNRIGEIEKWFLHNNAYILELDPVRYRSKILEYIYDYCDLLYMFAGAVGAQNQDLLSANELYGKEIAVLTSVEIEDGLKNLKMASCFARIADNYYQLGDLPLCKQYCDKAFPFLLNPTKNLEYCDILNSLANSYYNTNQPNLAARLKLNEIQIRDSLEGDISLTDWGQYFLYIVGSDPAGVILQNRNLGKTRTSEGGNANFYLILGKAYSMLMDTNNKYQDTAELYFRKVDSVLVANKDYYEKYNLKNYTLANLNEEMAAHYSQLGLKEKSYDLSKLALKYYPADNYASYYKVALKATLLHDESDIKEYLPKYYYGMEKDLLKMLPILGSVESDVYLGDGNKPIYHIPEWVSWNPTDSISVSVAYDAALFMKGLTLRYNVLTPYLENHPEIVGAKRYLDRMRDSIYTINDDNAKMLALHQYELKEREILKEVNNEQSNIHWRDIKGNLKEDEASVEFVKYTANAYSWSEGIPTPHYAAILLLGNSDYPFFVDLFDENELYDTYTLQPKSYDTEAGTELFEKLWGKLDKYITGESRVYFSPMGMLNLINIEALTDSSGVTALKRYNLTRVSSTRQIVYSKEESPIQSVVSYGGIDYTEMAEAIVDSLNTRGNWNYLKNTLTEVRNVEAALQKNNIQVTTIIGSNATEASFKALDGTATNVIHIASHGFYIPEQRREDIPYYVKSDYTQTIKDELFYSGLIMSGGQSAWIDSTFKAEEDDGILTSYEISKLDLHNVDLVVLSACETGLGDNLFDGIFGLQRAFKKAGVTSILMSLWSINDRATLEYMELFYNFLTSGLSKRESYKRTVSEMRNRYQDANYWASFVLLD